MEILVLNLTRMGDIIQTSPLVRGLRKRYPQARITLVISKEFAAVSDIITDVDEVTPLDMIGLLKIADNSSIPVMDKYKAVKSALAEVYSNRKFDIAFNLSHSKASAFILYLAPCLEINGITMTKDGYRRITSRWLTYFFNFPSNRFMNPFNLVDIYKLCADIHDAHRSLYVSSERPSREAMDNLLGVRMPGEKLVALQPGASHRHKQWDPGLFNELSQRIKSEYGYKTVLLGSRHETHLGEKIQADINLIGKTTVKELKTVLSECALLVTNDTGTMHVASAVGIRIILLSLGAAHFTETGPYGDGHFIIHPAISCFPCSFMAHCPDMKCTGVIKPDHVMATIDMVFGGRPVSDSPIWKNVALYRSEFDKNELVYCKPQLPVVLDKTMFFKAVYRLFWLLVFDGKRITATRQDLAGLFSGFTLKPESFDIKDVLSCLERISSLLKRAIDLSGSLEEKIRSGATKMLLLELTEELERIDSGIVAAGTVNTYVQPVTNGFKMEKENVDQGSLAEVARQFCILYEDLWFQVKYFRELCEAGISIIKQT